jgi:hypothetical protein
MSIATAAGAIGSLHPFRRRSKDIVGLNVTIIDVIHIHSVGVGIVEIVQIVRVVSSIAVIYNFVVDLATF